MPIEDEKTPVDFPGSSSPWEMHPELPKILGRETPPTGQNVRSLEAILEVVQKVLNESRDIRESAQKSCDAAITAFARLPVLETRMRRVEMVAVGALLINIALLLVSK